MRLLDKGGIPFVIPATQEGRWSSFERSQPTHSFFGPLHCRHMNRIPPPRRELFSERVRREVLDDLGVDELVRLADTHNLGVQFAPTENVSAPSDALMDVRLYDPTEMLYAKTIDANDPIWEAFGGFIPPHDAHPLCLEDLALFHEWRFRKARLEREGYFADVERLYGARRQRVHDVAELFVTAVEKTMDEADGPQALLIDGWEGSLRSVTAELQAQLASPAYPDSVSTRVFVNMDARLKELSDIQGVTDLAAQTFKRLAKPLKDLRKIIEAYAYRSFRTPNLPSWHETSAPVHADYMPSYNMLLQRAARGADPRTLLPWFEVSAEKLVAEQDDWMIGGLRETLELILQETPFSPPSPVSVAARTSDRPPPETLPGMGE